jgi:hypothetical protein
MSQSPVSGSEGRAITPLYRNASLVIAVVVSAIALAAISVARHFPGTGQPTDPGASRFPIIYASVLILLCVVMAVDALRRPLDRAAPTLSGAEFLSRALSVAFGVVLMALCVWAITLVGYLPATFAYLVIAMWAMGFRHPVWVVVLAAVMTAALYAAFSIGLNVPLPVGSLFE